MLKNILKLKGAQQLEKKEQKEIQGGEFCAIHCLSECYSGSLDQAEIDACGRNCQRLANQYGNTVGGGF